MIKNVGKKWCEAPYTKTSAVSWRHNTGLTESFTFLTVHTDVQPTEFKHLTDSHYTATSSPKESGRLSAFRTLRSRGAASAPSPPSAWLQLSRSSLSSVLDSYSEPIPDSLKRRSSSAPRTCSPSRELSSLGVSPTSWPCSWPSAARVGKRKHSSRTPLPPSAWRQVSVLGVLGEQGWVEGESQALLLTCRKDGVASVPTDVEKVSGSRGAPAGLDRNVISSRLSWEPTETQRRACVLDSGGLSVPSEAVTAGTKHSQ